jgi:hypothetical protein
MMAAMVVLDMLAHYNPAAPPPFLRQSQETAQQAGITQCGLSCGISPRSAAAAINSGQIDAATRSAHHRLRSPCYSVITS